MTQSAQKIKIEFFQNIEEIAKDLIKIYDLRFKSESDHLSDPLIRWMDFRLRYIEPEKRKIFAAKEFPATLPKSVVNGLNMLMRKMKAGHDINGYQSKGIIKSNDVGNKNKAKRTDLLWADWGVHHLHITDIPLSRNNFFSARKCSDGENWLLFCFFLDGQAFFIDIKKHDFEDFSLLEKISRNWPAYMERFELKGYQGGEQTNTPSAAEIKALRTAGINSMILIDGKAFTSPTGGITSAATSGGVMDKIMQLQWWISELANHVADPTSAIHQQVKKLGVVNPEYRLAITPKGLIVVETTKNIGLHFSRNRQDQFSVQAKRHQQIFFPAWALKKISHLYFKEVPLAQSNSKN